MTSNDTQARRKGRDFHQPVQDPASVTAPITRSSRAVCVWMGVQLSLYLLREPGDLAATLTAAAQMPQNTETAAPSQTNANNLRSFSATSLMTRRRR